MTSDFEGLCRITKGKLIPAPKGGNRSTSRSNGTSITIIGSKSQSLSSIDGKALATVSGAAVLHVEFQTGELISIETNSDHDRLVITIDGPDAISCASEI